MATIAEKVKKLIEMFGDDDGEKIALAAAKAQAQADASGIEHKEAETPAPEVDEAPEATKEGMPEAEIDFAEDTEAGGDLDAWQEEEAAPAEGEEAEFYAIGDVDVAEYGTMMAELFAQALAPLHAEIASLKEALSGMKETETAVKEHQAEGVSLVLEAAKEHETRIKEVEAKNAQLSKALQGTLTILKELQSDMPSGIGGGFVASQSKETELSDAETALKDGPQADPLAGFLSFVLKS